MYHSVSEDPPATTRGLSVSPKAFDVQMRHLRDEGFEAITFGRYTAALAGEQPIPERTVVITFDDGYADTIEQAAPVLERYGLVATTFVTTGWLADAGQHAAGRPLDRTLTESQVRALAAQGIEIGAHSHSHSHLDQLTVTDLRHELRDSRAILEDVLGAPVPNFAYPFGHSSTTVRRETGALGFHAAAAVENALPGPSPSLLAVPRLTISRSTGSAEFRRLVQGRGVLRAFAVDRTLTNGYKVVRRLRSARGAAARQPA